MPLHRRQKLMASLLSKDLRKKYKRKSLPIRKGDTIKIMRGEFTGSGGEVTRVSPQTYKIYISGITTKKADGTDVEGAIDPSNVTITELFMDDKERRNVLERNI